LFLTGILDSHPVPTGRGAGLNTGIRRSGGVIGPGAQLVAYIFVFIGIIIIIIIGARGGIVFKALRYKPIGRGFDARRYHWNFL
jgi:hypothetical protein